MTEIKEIDEYGLKDLQLPELFMELGQSIEDSRPYSREYLDTFGCGTQDYLTEKIDDAEKYKAALLQELLRRNIKLEFLESS